MMAKNHLLVTSATSMAIYSYGVVKFNTSLEFYFFYIFSLFGCLLPDIDEKESYIGRKLIFISIFVSMFLKHRTLTHYLIVPLVIISLGYFYLNGTSQLIMYSLSFGIFLHGAEDMVTNNGIKGYLFPFFSETNIVLLPSFMRLETGGTVELLLSYFCFFPLNFFLVFKGYL